MQAAATMREPHYAEEALLRECTDTRRLVEMLDAFAANVADEEAGSAPQPWGDKIGHSIFDEDEVLGLPMCFDDEEFDDVYAEGEDREDEADEGEENLDDREAARLELYHLQAVTSRDEPPFAKYRKEYDIPRGVKLIEPLCCAYRLDRDLHQECVICLDPFLRGQNVWCLPCAHTLHRHCAVRFFGRRRVKPACPVCRCDIKRFGDARPSGA